MAPNSGEKETRRIPLTREKTRKVNRSAGQAARAMLGHGWDWREATPDAADRIRAAFARAQDGERRRLRTKDGGGDRGDGDRAGPCKEPSAKR